MKNEIAIPDEIITNKIYLIREQKVMLDRDLADLYKVETKQLKRQVRRNIERFPEDFMFQLNNKEFTNWRSQFGTSNISDKMGLRYAPFAFTEQACPEEPKGCRDVVKRFKQPNRHQSKYSNNKGIYQIKTDVYR
ncbi:MAG: ORF6N domain-containing protein [Lutibacter sp.]|nr:ORF6N domain-containing protein [Lutibacter sp.]